MKKNLLTGRTFSSLNQPQSPRLSLARPGGQLPPPWNDPQKTIDLFLEQEQTLLIPSYPPSIMHSHSGQREKALPKGSSNLNPPLQCPFHPRQQNAHPQGPMPKRSGSMTGAVHRPTPPLLQKYQLVEDPRHSMPSPIPAPRAPTSNTAIFS